MQAATETDLSIGQKDALKRAKLAAQRDNFDYAITLLQSILKDTPNFLAGRQLLRETAIRKNAQANKLTKGLGTLQVAGIVTKAQLQAKKNPQEALVILEQALAIDPTNTQANMLLSEVAQALDMWETAALAHETIAKADPKNTQNLHALGKVYLKLRDKRAKDIFTTLLNINPHDGEALSCLKDAEAQQSMQEGNWEKAESYRDVLRDKEEAVRLEQSAAVVKSEEAIDALLAETYAQYEAEPNNAKLVQRMADLYRQKDDLERAIQCYEAYYEMTGRGDSNIEKTIGDLKLRLLNQQIQQAEAELAKLPEGPQAEEQKKRVEELHKQRAIANLQERKNRVAKYPNDLQFRFELGEALFHSGDISGAIPELQLSLRQPAVRLRAMMLLALCFKAKGQLDLAAKRLEEAASEIIGMDNTKKEILYNLGLLYEELGNNEKSIEILKQIYEVDYGYRDVAQRVESSYAKK
jgi:tetratricopeptide (TPR) repeat protein